MSDHVKLTRALEEVGQAHVLAFFDELTVPEQESLLAQVRALDLAALPGLIETYVKAKAPATIPGDLAPAPYVPLGGGSWDVAKAKAAGEGLIKAGKVAAFVVAGGQGSRLGFEGPKGCYPAGAVTGRPLFQFFAEQILAQQRRHGVVIPWYIMTSPLNHQATITFFDKNGYFGLSRHDVMFFPQGVMPSLDMQTGRLLMSSKGEIATNPDGHGGAIKALWVSGAAADMRKRGIEHLSYFQVDNPHVKVIDPVFLGLHAFSPESSAEMSSKMIPKSSAEEKVGVFCASGGKVMVIEYSDLPASLMQARDAQGKLRFIAGSIAVHVIAVEFIERLAQDPRFALPYHRAEKKIPCIDPSTGRLVTPEKNNGVKLERFIFDALPLCRRSLVMETRRSEEFAPIKNASGADSVQTCHELQTSRTAEWLERVGVKVPRRSGGEPDCVLELSPLTALEPEDLEKRRGLVISPGSKHVL